MKKAIEFSQNQKRLIWDRIIAPNNGTQEEAEHFIETCESFGLNPLLNDIVFQKFGNQSARFITTRDGLLRVATGQPGFVGAPNANVVKEGDIFKFNPSEGTVEHEFGAKRGKIQGAYAVMKHKTFNSVAFFADFAEYFNSLSGVRRSKSGKPNVWDTMPSAMIIKIAEVFVIRRQFPLGGLYTQEEMFLEENGKFLHATEQINNLQQGNNQKPQNNDQPIQVGDNNQTPANNNPTNPNVNIENKEGKRQFVVKEQVDELQAIVNQIAEVRNVEPQKIMGALGKPLTGYESQEFDQVKAKLHEWLEKAKNSSNNQSNQPKTQPQTQEQEKQDPGQENTSIPSHTFVMGKKEFHKSPSGKEVIKFFVQGKEDVPIFARTEEMFKKVSTINEGDAFNGKLKEERGFVFIVDVNQNVNQSA